MNFTSECQMSCYISNLQDRQARNCIARALVRLTSQSHKTTQTTQQHATTTTRAWPTASDFVKQTNKNDHSRRARFRSDIRTRTPRVALVFVRVVANDDLRCASSVLLHCVRQTKASAQKETNSVNSTPKNTCNSLLRLPRPAAGGGAKLRAKRDRGQKKGSRTKATARTHNANNCQQYNTKIKSHKLIP